MKCHSRNGDNGQVLIYVALALFIIIGFAALIVDGGSIYVTRRNLQDAADAGALAGAGQLCFEKDTSLDAVEAVAQRAAMTDTLADQAEVSVSDGYIVTVVARTSTETYFGAIIGLPEVEVAASASAMCSSAVEGNYFWPVAVDRLYFDTLYCNAASGEGELAAVFLKNNTNTNLYCEGDFPEDLEPGEYDQVCQCGGDFIFNEDIVSRQLGSAHIKWLSLYKPSPPWTGVGYFHNCDIKGIRYWLQYGHPGPVNAGDCLPGFSAIGGDIRLIQNAIDTYANRGLPERLRQVVLYDNPCETCVINGQPGDDVCCSQNEFYRVSGLGCVAVVGYADNVILPRTGGGECQFEALIVQKQCGAACASVMGSVSEAERTVRLMEK